MVADRVAFLDAGHYAGVTRAPWRTPCSADGTRRGRLLDLGGGTGHHLAGVLDRLPERGGRRPGLVAVRRPPRRPGAPPRGRGGRRQLGAPAGPGRRRRPRAGRVRPAQRAGDRPGPAARRPAGRRDAGGRPPGGDRRAARAAPGRPGQGRPAGDVAGAAPAAGGDDVLPHGARPRPRRRGDARRHGPARPAPRPAGAARGAGRTGRAGAGDRRRSTVAHATAPGVRADGAVAGDAQSRGAGGGSGAPLLSR